MPATPAWLASIEALFNRGIEASQQASAVARRLQGTALRVDIEGLASLRATVIGGRLALLAAPRESGEAAAAHDDATLTGSPLALFDLARGGANSAARRPAQVRGNAEVANSYRQLFSLARPDLEEELSRIVGDLPARRLVQLAQRTVAWADKARRTAAENVSEYLLEEGRDLVNKTELDEFLQGVDALRETADRVEARLARLEQRLKGPL